MIQWGELPGVGHWRADGILVAQEPAGHLELRRLWLDRFTRSGTEYDILVHGELGTLTHTESGMPGTSWTYLNAAAIAESELGRLTIICGWLFRRLVRRGPCLPRLATIVTIC